MGKALLEGCVPYPEEFGKLYREKGYWADITISDMIDEAVKKYGPKEALVFGNNRYTYTQFGEKINRLALHFLEAGLKPMDRVVFQFANTSLNVIALQALIKIGVIPILALPAHRFTEINHFVGHSGAVALFTPTGKYDYVKMAEEVQAQQKTLKYLFVEGETKNTKTISVDKMMDTPIEDKYPADHLAQFRPDPDQVVFMLLTGGTTGVPKMIPRTHNDYVYNVRHCGSVGNYDDNTVFLAVLPMNHNYNLGCPGYWAAFNYGGKCVVATGMDEDSLFSAVEKEKVTIIAAAGPLIARWLTSPAPAKYNTSSIKIIQNGGARLAPELRLQIREKFKCFPQEVYGTAEGLLNLVPLDADEDMVINSSGKPISPGDEIKVVDDNGNEVPNGQTGELIVRGPYTIRGYYKAPDHNATAFTADGFYRMGDIVRKNDKGFVFTEGRKKDLINRGGEKISCEEVENFILAYPKVENVSLVAMPDKVFGERACAFIKPKKGETIVFDELIKFMKGQNIASFKLPERMELVDEYPISPAGKILKRELVAIVTKKLEEEGAL